MDGLALRSSGSAYHVLDRRAVFYPRVICPFTGSDKLEWRISKGLGSVYATTIVHPAEGKP